MTLPTSGAISLGQVRTEFAASGGISLGASNVRTLFGKPSGTISLDDGYGKSAIIDPIPAVPSGIIYGGQTNSDGGIPGVSATFFLDGHVTFTGWDMDPTCPTTQYFLNPVGNTIQGAYSLRFVGNADTSLASWGGVTTLFGSPPGSMAVVLPVSVFGVSPVRSSDYDSGYVPLNGPLVIIGANADYSPALEISGTIYIRRNSDGYVASTIFKMALDD